jgi:HAD ATPase, P-type, family IC
VDMVIAEVLPDGKEEVIRKLQNYGKVAMVGDGINDAVALTRADLGIAIGAGTDVAIDAADLVLMKSKVRDIPKSIRLSRATIRNIHENLFWAFFYNVICIPLAAGFYSAIFHWNFAMSPMVGAAAMSLSSFSVCLNALRLNLFNINNSAKDHRKGLAEEKKEKLLLDFDSQKKESHAQKEKEIVMEKHLDIEGMMCGHCSGTVKKALEALPQVEKAEVSHETGKAVVTLKEAVADEVLKKAVEDQEYTVKSIS